MQTPKRKRSGGKAILIFMGLLFLGIGVIPFLFNMDGDGYDSIVPLIVLGVLGSVFLVGVGVVGFSRWRVGRPEVMISKTNLAVGERFSATIDHRFRGNLRINQILVQLVFRETATYQQGTDTRTVTFNHVIDNYEYPGGHFRSGQYFQQSYDLQIPADGMHTLDVRRNKLQWFFILKMDIPRLPDFKNEYELTVSPELIAGAEDNIWS